MAIKPAAAFALTEIARTADAVAVRDSGGNVMLLDADDFDAPTSETWDEWSARVDWIDWIDWIDSADSDAVEDPDGGVWLPGPEAIVRIMRGEDAADIAAAAPMLGTWHS